MKFSAKSNSSDPKQAEGEVQAQVVDIQSRGTTLRAEEDSSLVRLLDQFDVPGPRYTSYPTIDHCSESIGAPQYVESLQARCVGKLQRPLSLYVHVPFCESVCYYCACNKVVTKKRDRVSQYLNWLEKEAMLVARASSRLSPVTQFHMGGGTPTFLLDEEIHDLVKGLKTLFGFAEYAEMSIEIDPRTVDAQRLRNLRALGFNRVSFGVQDFDPLVQKAVHREQSFESIQAVVNEARALKFDSINVDLIYGLPKQTLQSFSDTLDKLVSLSPDRVAFYGYAHLPDRFKPQRRIHSAELPNAHERVLLLSGAVERMQAEGYDYIGMDHFAKKNDSLSKAKRLGTLHRNFQGYTTQADTDLIGLGVSAISKVGTTLVQNNRTLEEYGDQVDRGNLPVFRGHVSNRDDIIRQSVIMSLLCQGQVNFKDFSQLQWMEFRDYFHAEMGRLGEFVAHRLLDINDEGVYVTPKGWYFVRPIAMVFDEHLAQSRMNRSKVL